MDYNRKELVDWVRGIYQNLDEADKQDALRFFPELRESEDERIRRDICIWLKHKRENCTYPTPNKETLSAWIAYLEKQKEENHDGKKWIYEDDYHKDMERCFNDGKDEVLENPEKYGLRKEQKPISFSEPYNPDEYEAVMEGNATSLKRKGLKPAEKQDYSGLNDCERAIHRGFLAAGVENVPVGIIKETAKECITQMKPAEWSEEDDWKRKELIQYLEEKGDYRTTWMTWLKSLKPQSKVEWSEEDEKMLARIIERGQSQIQMFETGLLPEHIAWLKSLRPSWKPSEEQMRGLKFFLDYHRPQRNAGTTNWKEFDAVESLYNDLKKL